MRKVLKELYPVNRVRVFTHVTHLVRVIDMRHVDDIELVCFTATGRIDRKQDRPSDEAADEADDDRHLEQSQHEEAIETVVVQDVRVGKAKVIAKPIEET